MANLATLNFMRKNFKVALVRPFLLVATILGFDNRDKFSLQKFFVEMWRYILARTCGVSHVEWMRASPSDVFANLPSHKKAIHVGGHLGREYDSYTEVLFIEPIPKYALYLRLLGRTVIQASVCGDVLYVTTYEQASSSLKPLDHQVKSIINTLNLTLDQINDGSYDLLVIDAQGSELNILKSGTLLFQSIVVECSYSPRYAGAPTKSEIVTYLLSKNYSLAAEYQHGHHDIYDLLFTLNR